MQGTESILIARYSIDIIDETSGRNLFLNYKENLFFFSGIDVAGMRTHFYPEGGWGWLVCAAGFLALLLTTGMQLAFGLLYLYAVRHLGEVYLMDIGMLSILITN